MKRAVRVLLLCAVFAALLSGSVLADETDIFDGEKLREAVPESARELMEDFEPTADTDFSGALEKIVRTSMEQLGGSVKNAMKSAVLIMTAAVICGVVGVLYSPSGGIDALRLAGVLAVAAIAAGDISTCVGLGRSMITEVSEFSKVLLPTLTATAAVSGAVSSAAAKYAAAALFMDVLISCVENILLPLIYAYIAAVIAECAVGGEGLSGAASFLKWLTTSLLTAIVLAFVVYLSVSGLVTGAADAATVRVAKTAISTTLPVVGGIISDAASTVLLGASVIKSAVGAFGMLTVSAVCLMPVLRLACHYLLYKGAAKLSSAIAGGTLASVAGGISGAFGMVMGAMGACAMMMFFSIISFVQAVS